MAVSRHAVAHSSLSDKVIINAAITGMVPTKKDNPNVPISSDEIVADAKRCWEAGASIIHVHAREADGTPTHRGEIYRELFLRIRQACPGLMISGSSSGRRVSELEKRAEVLEPETGFHPDFASLTLGSLNFRSGASVNAPETIQGLARAMRERGIVPELEMFDFGMVDYAHHLIKEGVLDKPLYGNILLGSLGTLSATPYNLAAMVRNLPEGMTWSATGIGRFQFQVNAMALSMGGHVRVGLEDNLWYDDARTQQASNPGLIERVVQLAGALGREIASPDEARAMIGMSKA
jgi:3-keto-5-aminohexanoate cleavage enzyme